MTIDPTVKMWLYLVTLIAFVCLMAWVHRSLGKGILVALAAPLALAPTALLVLVPMNLIGYMLSSFFPVEIRTAVHHGFGVAATAILMVALLVWYCISQRHASASMAMPMMGGARPSETCANPGLRRRVK